MTPKNIRRAAWYGSIAVFVLGLAVHYLVTPQYTLPALMVAWVLAMVAVDQRQIKFK